MLTEAGQGKVKDLGSDHPENDTTVVGNTSGCPCWCIGPSLKTLTIQISLHSRNTRRHNALAGMSMERTGRCWAHTHWYAQARAWHVQAKDTRTQRSLSTSAFVGVNCVAGFICANMLKKQSKARAGGLFEEHPGCCFVRQTGSRCESARCPALDHRRRFPQTCSSASCHG